MKKLKRLGFFIFLLLFLSTNSFSKELKKVTLQLSWFDQFQFAGYYMAKEMGFYRNAGLDVEILPFSFELNIPKMVDEGKVDFAIGRENLVIEKYKYKNIVALAALFQASPLILLTTKDSGLDSIGKFKNKKIMATRDDENEISLKAMITSNNIDLKNLIFIEHSHNINDLIEKKVDIISAYISKAPFWLQKQDIGYNTFHPKDYGFDMYSDFLITNKNSFENQYETSENFKKASLLGWEYAYNNIEQTIDFILKKYNYQNISKDELTFEANELKKLSYLNNIKLGDIKQEKLQRIYDLYNVMGLVKSESNIDDFIAIDKKSKINRWIITKFEEYFDYSILWKVLIGIFLISAAIFYRHYLLAKVNKRLKILVNIKTRRLKTMNKKLATRIKDEIEKHQEKDRILAQQQKMVSMGQMLENIAHQWRQPLSVITTSASGLKIKKQLQILSDEELIQSIDKIVETSKYLSETIDDFRYFFKPQKEKNKFDIAKSIEKSLIFLESSIKENSIIVEFDLKNSSIISYETELIQVFINILNNSKDAFIENNVKNRVILISAKNFSSRVLIEIKDNAGGIEEEILEKVFEPYFSTKHQYNGTGIGLYMSSQIIKTHMNGDIFMKNCKFKYQNIEYFGASTTIILNK